MTRLLFAIECTDLDAACKLKRCIIQHTIGYTVKPVKTRDGAYVRIGLSTDLPRPAESPLFDGEAPHTARCGNCGRKSYAKDAAGMICNFPQPDGQYCAGMFKGVD